MRWSGFSVLVLVVLSAALLEAQRAGGPMVAEPRLGTGLHSGTNLRPHRGRGFGAVGLPWYYPDWGYGESVWNLPDSYQQPVAATSPQVMVMQIKDSRTPAVAVEPPKLIEVPQAKEAAEAKGPSTVNNQQATLFVLKSGEQIESHYYLLTSQSLQIEVGHDQRTIPIYTLDIDSTIAANRQRRIELFVPRDGKTVFLGF